MDRGPDNSEQDGRMPTLELSEDFWFIPQAMELSQAVNDAIDAFNAATDEEAAKGALAEVSARLDALANFVWPQLQWWQGLRLAVQEMIDQKKPGDLYDYTLMALPDNVLEAIKIYQSVYDPNIGQYEGAREYSQEQFDAQNMAATIAQNTPTVLPWLDSVLSALEYYADDHGMLAALSGGITYLQAWIRDGGPQMRFHKMEGE